MWLFLPEDELYKQPHQRMPSSLVLKKSKGEEHHTETFSSASPSGCKSNFRIEQQQQKR